MFQTSENPPISCHNPSIKTYMTCISREKCVHLRTRKKSFISRLLHSPFCDLTKPDDILLISNNDGFPLQLHRIILMFLGLHSHRNSQCFSSFTGSLSVTSGRESNALQVKLVFDAILHVDIPFTRAYLT